MNEQTRNFILDNREMYTSEQMAQVISEDPRFAQRITKTALRGLFAGTRVGVKLEDVSQNPAVPEGLRYDIRRVLMTAGWEDGYLDGLDPEKAAELRQGLALLVQYAFLTQPEAEAFLELGGGYFLDRVSAEEIEAEWVAKDDADLALSLRKRAGDAYNEVIAAIDAGSRSADELKAVFSQEMGD